MSDAAIREELSDLKQLGGIFLDIDQKLERLDFTEPLTDFVGVLEDQESSAWDSRMSPAGEAWPPLSEYTIRKKGHDRPLILTGALRAAMTDRHAPGHVGEVQPTLMTFGTDIDYAGFHEYGTQRIPQREFASISEENLNKLVNAITDHVVASLQYTIRG